MKVIGILTAITIIGFANVFSKVVVSSLRSNPSNASDKLVIDMANSDTNTFFTDSSGIA